MGLMGIGELCLVTKIGTETSTSNLNGLPLAFSETAVT